MPFIYPGSSVHEEVKLFAQAGLTPRHALHTATTRPVAFFGIEKSQRSVGVGKKAEMVLLNGNPLQYLENLDRINAVLTHKLVFLQPALNQMEVQAPAAAQNYK